MLIDIVLSDRFLNRNVWYNDMHGIVTTRVLHDEESATPYIYPITP